MAGNFELVKDPGLHLKLGVAVKKHLPLSAQIWNITQMLGRCMYPEEISVRLFQYLESNMNTGSEDDPCLVVIFQPDLMGKYLVVVWNPVPLTEEQTSSLDSLIDWKLVDAFSLIHSHIAPSITKLIERHQRKGKEVEKGHVLTLPQGNIAEVPEDSSLKLKDLSKEGLMALLDTWEHTVESSWPVAQWIHGKLPMSVGLFDKTLLVSGALYGPIGVILAVFTQDKYQRRGCAYRVMKSICKNVQDAGLIPIVDVYEDNHASRALMKKLGFTLDFEQWWYLLEGV